MKLDKRSKNAAENCKTIEELQVQIAVFSFKEKLTLQNRYTCKDGTRQRSKNAAENCKTIEKLQRLRDARQVQELQRQVPF
jgi:hypothetical protein